MSSMSAAAFTLVAKYLTQAQMADVAVTLAKKLKDEKEDLDILASLIPQLDHDALSTVYPYLLDFSVAATIKGSEAETQDALQFIEQSDSLCRDTIASVLKHLQLQMASAYNFIPEFQEKVIEFRGDSVPKVTEELSNDQLLNLFGFLNAFFTRLFSSEEPQLDKLLTLYLGHKNDKVAAACSKVLRWRTNSIPAQCKNATPAEFYWSCIFSLLQGATRTKRHLSNALTFWLRMLNSGHDFQNDAYFQKNVVNQDFYWDILQKGMAGESHENRKFCLSILQLSLKAVNTSFATPLVTWDQKNSRQLLREWSKFTTLYEILGIDTSLHQTQAAVNDILAIITPESLIHPSWGFCLLSTGFRASMDLVRKYSAHILFSIEPQNLHLLQHGLPFLEHCFLPYMMLSRHFAVRRVNRLENECSCEYGEKFSTFIASILRSLLQHEELESVAYSVLSVLVLVRESFDAVRIYTALGLVDGLQSRKVLRFGKHDELVLKLFDDFSEGHLFKRVVQTLNFKLLSCFQLDSIANFANIVAKFTSFNGFEIFNDHLNLVAKYVTECGIKFEELMETLSLDVASEAKIVSTRIALQLIGADNATVNEFISNQNATFILGLIESGVEVNSLPSEGISAVSQLLSNTSKNPQNDTVYDTLSMLPVNYKEIHPDPLNLQPLWNLVAQSVMAEDYPTLAVSLHQLQFLNKAVSDYGFESMNVNFELLLDFVNCTFSNASRDAKSVKKYHKLKENVRCESLKILSRFMLTHKVGAAEIGSVWETLNFESTHSVYLTAATEIIQLAFDQDEASPEMVILAVSGLLGAMKELSAERLRLSDK